MVDMDFLPFFPASLPTLLMQIYPSIQPLSFADLRSGISRYSRCQPPWQQLPSSPGRSWGVPKPDEISNPSSEFWIHPRFPGRPPKCFKTQGNLIRCLKHFYWLLWQRSSFLLLISKLLFPTLFLPLVTVISFSWSRSKAQEHRWKLEE